MDAGTALFGRLTAVGAVTALIGTRIYPIGTVPQPRPASYVVYDEADTEYARHYKGVSNLAEATVDITCVAATSAESLAIAKAVREALNGLGGTWGGGDVRRAGVRGRGQEPRAITPGNGPKRFESDLTVQLWYRPS